MNEVKIAGKLAEVKYEKFNKRDGSEGSSTLLVIDLPRDSEWERKVVVEYKGRDSLHALPGDDVKIDGLVESRGTQGGTRYFTSVITFRVNVTNRTAPAKPQIVASGTRAKDRDTYLAPNSIVEAGSQPKVVASGSHPMVDAARAKFGVAKPDDDMPF